MKRILNVVFLLSIAVLSLIFLFPLILTVTNSFMSEAEINAIYKTDINEFLTICLIPGKVVLGQYYSVLIKKIRFLFMFWNSVIIAAPIICGQAIVASMAAYAFSKLRFRWRETLFFIYIITMMMPFQVTLVPNYIIADKLNLIGKYTSIIFPGIFSTFGVFLLRQFMVFIPDEYVKAALVDGARHGQIFLKIIIPLSIPGLAALGILTFIDNWNLVEQPLIFLREATKYPLSLYLAAINQHERGLAFASATVYMIPVILVFLYGESYLIKGIQQSGIKG